MFGGFANKAEVQERKKQLISQLEGDTEYVMVDGAKTTLSQYNDVSSCFNFCLPPLPFEYTPHIILSSALYSPMEKTE